MSKGAKAMEEWDVGRLVPYDKNVKIHTKEQITKIANSILKHGLINPPNVEPDGTIISGHGRALAIKELGWKTVPVFVRYDLTKAEAAAARLADNKVAEGDVDTNMLQEELRWLEKELDDDLTMLGFDDRELAFLTDDIGELDDDLLSGDLMLSEPDADHATESTESEMHEADAAMVKLEKALGFKDVTTAESRVLSRFMALISGETGEADPRAALVAFAEGVMADD